MISACAIYTAEFGMATIQHNDIEGNNEEVDEDGDEDSSEEEDLPLVENPSKNIRVSNINVYLPAFAFPLNRQNVL